MHNKQREFQSQPASESNSASLYLVMEEEVNKKERKEEERKKVQSCDWSSVKPERQILKLIPTLSHTQCTLPLQLKMHLHFFKYLTLTLLTCLCMCVFER